MTARAITALALYVVWFALAFGLATLRQYRRTGDTGLRIGPRFAAGWQRAATLLMAAALLTGLAAPVASLLGMPTIPPLDGTAAAAVGIALMVTGIAATVLAQTSMGTSWRIGVDPGESPPLVTGGAFRVARNPIFTAMMVTAAGIALTVPNAIAVGGLIAAIIAIELQVRLVEEPYLRRQHGQAYAAYEQRVGRFLPGIGRRTA
ncbi:methyltransferase family protein [Spirilliplanes yamanashiensis]|uniref:Isoprenylcysteine carboxylmethyltransferase family protein n=1 Tax=Spirilliplanes yamanashiensis TaxID=42233 RepID=A0A8J4DM21_9ACTN|nr:isoprenylcysteine carboxylmethyltransferase family protein [Spirilliplanes yamanashiensis]MDP9818361.1 protein-S-isoprenylcysteine O-methyltransferase Ste14 [Spirilliplanes yamanashiensis]GIJ06581.1 hypothetical protein Sya03_59330 [Spirilliplanes yamanashiensis]